MMEYTSLFEPLLVICLSLFLGLLIGGSVVSYLFVKERVSILKELDSKTKQLDSYTNKYEDDGYEDS